MFILIGEYAINACNYYSNIIRPLNAQLQQLLH